MSNCGRPPRAVFVAALPVLILAAAAAVASKQPAAQTPPEKQTNVERRALEPGEAIERTIDRRQEHTYRVALDAGQFMRLVVDPRGMGRLSFSASHPRTIR